ncbi:MAG: vWA domain-containing protein [Pirellulaceae bacterium]
MNPNDNNLESQAKLFELPTPESAEMEPLAKALVALRRDEQPIAPSAELRRLVEARLDELETNTQGTVITKENAMLKNSTSRFRLRDWVFIGGGSIAAAVATTIIFWPPPKTDVAKVQPEHQVNAPRWEETGDIPLVGTISRKNQSVVRAQSEITVGDEWTAESMNASMKMKKSSPAASGMSAGGMPGMAGGMGAGGGMPGMPGMPGGGPSGAGEMAGKNPLPHYHVPGGRGYGPSFEAGGIPASDAPNPYPPAALVIESDPAGNTPVARPTVTAATELAAQARVSSPTIVSSNGAKGRNEGGRPADLYAKANPDKYRMRLAKEGQAQGVDALAKNGDEWHEKAYHFGSRFQVDRLGEQYNSIVENQFLAPTSEPLSTFSIDVDTASYSNIRRMLTAGQLPPPAAVRIEEMVNYFGYSYAQPKGKEPFGVIMETAECPWNPGHVLLRVGLKGKEIERKARPASNLVFLLDVSGSMSDENKLPLLKTTMNMLVGELTENDRVTIVTYAGDAGLKLEPTSGDQKQKITDVINSLSAGGSTNGSAGIELAYQKATEAFIKEGTNRVILATDGDLNVGVTSDDALVKLIKEKAAGGTFLTVLGFGEGNLKDGKLEQIADNGNGVYAYIDSVREGRKVMVEQLTGSLVTIAKDVKIQIEFNPAQIQSYRLLGYENRVMAAADFNNDKKDAGEIGAGHTVTALYELVPVEVSRKENEPRPDVEPLKYQKAGLAVRFAVPAAARDPKALTDAATSGELLTLKLRYKEPDGVESRLIEFPLKERGKQFNSASKDFQFAAAVASFGMILRGSQHRGSANTSAVAEIAAGAIGEDPNGLRAEFVDLVRRAERLGIK